MFSVGLICIAFTAAILEARKRKEEEEEKMDVAEEEEEEPLKDAVKKERSSQEASDQAVAEALAKDDSQESGAAGIATRTPHRCPAPEVVLWRGFRGHQVRCEGAPNVQP